MSFTVTGLEKNEIIGNIPENARGSLSFAAENATLIIGANVDFVNVDIYLKANSTIMIANNCSLEGALVTMENCFLRIGESCQIVGRSRLNADEGKSITIGKRCIIHAARFRTSDSHSVIDVQTQQRINQAKNIELGDDVFVDRHCFFYKGANIGAGSYVSIGSIVTRVLPANSLIAGQPAQAVRENVAWLQQESTLG